MSNTWGDSQVISTTLQATKAGAKRDVRSGKNEIITNALGVDGNFSVYGKLVQGINVYSDAHVTGAHTQLTPAEFFDAQYIPTQLTGSVTCKLPDAADLYEYLAHRQQNTPDIAVPTLGNAEGSLVPCGIFSVSIDSAAAETFTLQAGAGCTLLGLAAHFAVAADTHALFLISLFSNTSATQAYAVSRLA